MPPSRPLRLALAAAALAVTATVGASSASAAPKDVSSVAPAASVSVLARDSVVLGSITLKDTTRERLSPFVWTWRP